MSRDTGNREVLSEDSGEKGVTVLYNSHVDVSGVDEAKLVRKIDWRLIPWLSFLYLLSFLDRTSIGNARVSSQIRSLYPNFVLRFSQLYHLTTDLRLSDKEYLLCLAIFYFSYSIFEVRPPFHRRLSRFEVVSIGSKQCAPQENAPQRLAFHAYVRMGYCYGEPCHVCLLRPQLRSLQASQGLARTYRQLLGGIYCTACVPRS